MRYFKFKLFIIFLFTSFNLSAFSEKECLKSNFNITISHKAAPWGLLNHSLILKKTSCELDITYKQWNFFAERWQVDICRIPIHIKYGKGAVDIYKRKSTCPVLKSEKDAFEFCKNFEKLQHILLDNGLIFAKGLKENLESHHGKNYCMHQLLKGHLQEGIVYTPYSEKIFPKKEKSPTVTKSEDPFYQDLKKDVQPIIEKATTTAPFEEKERVSVEESLSKPVPIKLEKRNDLKKEKEPIEGSYDKSPKKNNIEEDSF